MLLKKPNNFSAIDLENKSKQRRRLAAMATASNNGKRAHLESDAHSIAPSEATTNFDTHSIAPSELTLTGNEPHNPPEYSHSSANQTEEPDLEHFTATGRPMSRWHFYDGFVNAPGNLGPNRVPFRFKDTSFISIPIPQSDIDAALAEGPSSSEPPSYGGDPAAGPAPQAVDPASRSSSSSKPRKSSLFSSIGKSRSKTPKRPSFRTVKMTRAEYLAYFAKDEQGVYICSEPRESGAWKAVIRARMADTDLQALGREDNRFAYGGGMLVMPMGFPS